MPQSLEHCRRACDANATSSNSDQSRAKSELDNASVEIQHCLVQPPVLDPLNCAANAGKSWKNSKPSTVCAAGPASSNSS